MKKTTVHITGMHCRSCELLIEDGLSDLPRVKRVTVNHKTGEAVVTHRGSLNQVSVNKVITDAGYTIGKQEKLPWFSTKKEDYNQLSKVVVALLAFYFIGKYLGIFDLSSLVSSNYSSLWVVFLVGLTAGISTCMALVGGLVLGASARFAKQKPLASAMEKFTPHIYFNLGRVVTFFVLGGLIGLVGSFLQLSLSAVGFLTILVGLSMLIIGAQLIDIFPRLNGCQITLPKGISRFFGMDSYKQAEYSHKNSAVMGGLTFFLPCGFTQAMQLYAISTGSAWTGALTMAMFALGTMPGLLGIGGLASIIKSHQSKLFFRFAGLVVMALAFFNISNGMNLTGMKVSASNIFKTQQQPVLGVNNQLKVLQATYSNRNGMQSADLVTTVGQPTRLEIAAQDNGAGCMSAVAIPGLTRETGRLLAGKTIVLEFTPQKSGKYPLVCTSMGMYHGVSITVL